MIAINKLSKRYGKSALVLKDVSLKVRSREFFTLLGPSGCGKTTLLRCIAGLEAAETGRIDIGGNTVLDANADIFVPPERRNIGMVFQSYAIWPHMSVLENVAFPARVRRLADPAGQARRALRTVELDHLHDRPATQLSGGQQQRVALARAIVGQPKVLLLDEPLSNLDAALREQMRGELRRLQKELGITTVLVTHDQAEALSMSDRIVLINAGTVEEVGAPEDLYLNPQTRFTASFLGDSVQIPATVSDDGKSVATPLGKFPRPEPVTRNGGASVYLRPERIRISTYSPSTDAVEATILERRFVGVGYEYDLAIGGETPLTLQIRESSETAHAVGSSVYLQIPENARIVL